MSTGKTYSTKYLLDSKNNRGSEGQVLSSTNSGIDWVTLSEISGVDGTGTANYLSKWLDANTITNSLVYDNGTNVGIGTTSPSSKLEVVEATANTAAAITVDSASWDAMLSLKNANGTWTILNDYTGAGTTGALAFWNGSYRMVIDNTGNVGIGTTSPDTGLHLYGTSNVSSGFTIEQVYGGTSKKFGFQPVYNDDRLDIWYNSNATAGITLKDGGNVGIGATNPLRKLHVVGDFAVNAGTGEYYGVLINGGESTNPKITIGDWHNSSATIHWDSSSNYLRIDSQHSTANAPIAFTGNDGATEYMRITSAGNVGIGTTSPDARLHVKASANGTYIFRGMSSSGTDLGGLYQSAAGDGEIYLKTSAVATNVRISSNNVSYLNGGDVGIGNASPQAKLHITGTVNTDDTKLYLTENTNLLGGYFKYNGDANINFIGGLDTTERPVISYPRDGSTLSLSTGSSTALHIDSSRNVGIGTTSPQASLHVAGNLPTTPTGNGVLMGLYTSGSSNYGNIQLNGDTGSFIDFSSSGTDWRGRILYDNSSNYMKFDTGGTERVRINSSGYVGIGTTNPVQKLQVNGSVYSAGGEFYVNDNSGITAVGNLIFKGHNGSSYFEGMRLTSSGNVGIGITSPDASLHVTTNSSSGTFRLSPQNGTYEEYRLDIVTQAADNGALTMKLKDNTFLKTYGYYNLTGISYGVAGYEDLLHLKNSGNVGIGTTSPSEKLEVSGNLKISSIGTGNSASSYDLLFYGTTSSGTQTDQAAIHSSPWATNSNGGNLIFETSNTSNALAERMRIDGDGKVGIGTTSPNEQLHIFSTASDLRLQSGGAGTASRYILQTDHQEWRIGSHDAQNDGLWFYDATGGGYRMLITPSGNVGIGTTSPASKLQVSTTNAANILTLHRDGSDNGANTTLNRIQFAQDYNSTQQNWGKIDLDSNSSPYRTDLKFYVKSTSGSEMLGMTVHGTASDGPRVGIGTTSPQQLLHVNGEAQFGPTSYQGDMNGGRADLSVDCGGTSQISWVGNYFQVGGTDLNYNMKMFSGHLSTWSSDLTIHAGNTGTTALLRLGTNGQTSTIVCNNGKVGIGTTSPSSDTLIEINGNSYTRGKTRGIATNYATSEGWAASTAVSSAIGYFGGNFFSNGPSSENKIEYDIGPFGLRELIWKTIPETTSNDDGGWNKAMDSFDHSAVNGFISVVYVKRSSSASSGNFYHGCSGSSTNNLGGTANTNPYFNAFGISSLPENVWCVAIGVIYAANDSNTNTSSLGGVYRLDTGVKITGATTYRQKPSNTSQVQRVYHYYSTSTTAKLDFAKPAFYVTDGSEPTLSELTAGAAGGSDDVYWTANGNDIHNDNTGNVGIGILAPTFKLHVKSDDSNDDIAYIHHDNPSQSSGTVLKVRSDAGDSSGYSLLDVSNNTGNALYVRGDRNVGIGTTSPAYSLHVETGGNTTVLSRTTSNAASAAFTTWNNNGSSGNNMQLKSYGQGVSGTTFGVNVSKTNMLWSSGDTLMAVGTIGATPLIFGTSNAERMRILSSGQLIVGGTAYGYSGTDLQVGNTSDSQNGLNILTSTTGYGYILFGDGLANASSYVGQIAYKHGDDYMMFQTNGSERVRINSSGNVGIGTTSPNHKLQVGGKAQIGITTSDFNHNNDFLAVQNTLGIYFNASENMRLGLLTGAAASWGIQVTDSGDGGNHLVLQPSQGGVLIGTTTQGNLTNGDLGVDGKVGIGTVSPSAKLEVIGTGTQLASTGYYINSSFKGSSNVGVFLGHNNTNNGNGMVAGINKLAFLTYGTSWGQRMVIDGSGNVGIGTTNPTALLDVATTSSTNVKVTKIANDTTTVYRYATSADATLEWTCGSYFNAEVVITASQTNGGTYNNLYIRGIWSNNHTSHHWDELEHVGSLTGTTFTITNGQNGSTAASGRLTLGVDYVNGSFATLNIRITDFFGTHSYTIT